MTALFLEAAAIVEKLDAKPEEKIVFSWFEYPNRQARDAANEKFMSDPEWLGKRAESERDGPIISSIKNMFLQPTAFSAVQ